MNWEVTSGYLSNPWDAYLLSRPDFMEEFSRNIAAGINDGVNQLYPNRDPMRNYAIQTVGLQNWRSVRAQKVNKSLPSYPVATVYS